MVLFSNPTIILPVVLVVARKTQLATRENTKLAAKLFATQACQARVNINCNPLQKAVFENPNTAVCTY